MVEGGRRSGRRLAAGLFALFVALPGASPAQEGPGAPERVTLQGAIDVALRNSPALEQAGSNVEIAEFNRLSAIGEFLPNLNLGYSFSDASTGRLDPTGQSIVTTSYTAQLTGSYQLFDGLRRFTNLRSSRRDVSAEEARYRQREYETVLSVKTSFYNAVANRELVRVEEDRVERQEDQLEFVRQQLELGRATRSDLLRSQVDLNDAKLALLTAENNSRASTFELAEAMGVRRRVAPVAEATLETGPLPYDRDELMRAGLETGPAVRSARAAREAAEAEVTSARSAYIPSLSLTGGWAWQNSSFPPTGRSWSLRLSGSYPLFNGFQRENQVFQARARADVAVEQERQAELALRSDLDAAYSEVETALAGIDLAERNVELSREDLKVSQERFRLGLATILDLQTAQIALEQAEVDLIRRRFDYQVGIARLEAILGRELGQGARSSGSSRAGGLERRDPDGETTPSVVRVDGGGRR